MRRCHALGRGCQDRESCTAADGEARPCPASTSCHTSDPARSAELAVHWSPTAPRLAGARRPWSSVKSSTSWTLFTPARELNGALAEADLSLEDFKEAHQSVFLGASWVPVPPRRVRRGAIGHAGARSSRHDIPTGTPGPGLHVRSTSLKVSSATDSLNWLLMRQPFPPARPGARRSSERCCDSAPCARPRTLPPRSSAAPS